jgi:hypothetical protein
LLVGEAAKRHLVDLGPWVAAREEHDQRLSEEHVSPEFSANGFRSSMRVHQGGIESQIRDLVLQHAHLRLANAKVEALRTQCRYDRWQESSSDRGEDPDGHPLAAVVSERAHLPGCAVQPIKDRDRVRQELLAHRRERGTRGRCHHHWGADLGFERAQMVDDGGLTPSQHGARSGHRPCVGDRAQRLELAGSNHPSIYSRYGEYKKSRPSIWMTSERELHSHHGA